MGVEDSRGDQIEVSKVGAGMITIQDPLGKEQVVLSVAKVTYRDGSQRFCLDSHFMGLQISADTHRDLEYTLMEAQGMLAQGISARAVAEDLQGSGVTYLAQ
ncbi:MAG: hypothetical protein WCW16_04575 [Candidatus Magasanikbacteria bacterium]